MTVHLARWRRARLAAACCAALALVMAGATAAGSGAAAAALGSHGAPVVKTRDGAVRGTIVQRG
jgi:hypothetical protein